MNKIAFVQNVREAFSHLHPRCEAHFLSRIRPKLLIDKERMNKQNIGFGSQLAEPKNEIELLKQTQAEDLVEYGFESEFIGRIPVRCVLNTLSEADHYAILKMPNNPVILSKKLDFAAVYLICNRIKYFFT